ncbi:MAG: 2-C-methyl-D-erythritol 2,4-cyclodiphosphate synthase [Bacilli bacterium]|jgi:2-C-methyl-D-erythritol 2,4-cyclodiphosphate synthase
MDIRVGYGYDIHRLEKGEYLLLAGEKIPSPYKTVAHSDGDILLHALSQSLLSAVGLEDIGTYFPDSKESTLGLDSKNILAFALGKVKEAGYQISNTVIDIVLEKPKLLPYKSTIKKAVSHLLNLDESRIAVHANTSEKVGPVGKEEAITVTVTTLVIKN